MSEQVLQPFLDGSVDRARFTLSPAPPRDPVVVDRLLAGVAEADITPPPGMPKAGFSRNACDGTGFRNRLRARVLHLRAGAASVAWVQLDLLSGSSLLQHLVAAAVRDRTDVPLHGIVTGATHTHAGVGHFDASDFYNRFAANRGGFDPAWTRHLADRVSGAVVEAHDTRRPARLAYGRTEVWGATRNRSLAPYVRNDTVEDRRLDPARKFAAVNPWLHLFRVDADASDGGLDPLAAWCTFSIHGTGVSQHCAEYHADVWAFLVEELAHGVQRSTGRRIVAAAVEGTHGDMAPALRPGHRGFLEAERIGRAIGEAAAELHARLEPDLTARIELAAGLREVDLDGPDGGAAGGIRLPAPALGASQVAGATENETPVLRHLPVFRPGMPKPFGNTGPQGAKWVLLSRWLQPRVLPVRGFPRVLTFQVLRIAGAVVVGLPFEMTVEAGRRVAAEVRARVDPAASVVVASVTNGYCGYCTTTEEYALQYYEGGHNLHGPRTQEWLATHAARLAAEVTGAADGQICDVQPQRRFDLHVHRYFARAGGHRRDRGFTGMPAFHDPAAEDHGFWEARWDDVAAGDLVWHEPLVRVEVEAPGGGWTPATHRGRLVDDQGTAVAVVRLEQGGHGDRYAARWYDPWLGGGRRHRFVLLAGNDRPEVASAPFDCGPGAA